ncbi:glycosyltransferase family 1 protein [Candidatus Parcubacteria bacterium]|nr:MAG: glycosyltransferase family 1 protein [Candidatus Parcubacteria bacterium]
MRIVLIITKARWGGAQRHVHDLAVGLRERGHDVAVWYGEHGELAERLVRAGIQVRHIPHLQREVRFGSDIRSFVLLTRQLRQESPDVVHLHSSKAGFSGALAARMAGVPRVVFTAHNWAFVQPASPLWRLVYWFLQGVTVWTAHRTIAVSQATARALRFPGVRGRMSIIHNALPPSFGKSLLPRKDARARLAELADVPMTEDAFWLLSMSEMIPVKGLDIALEAFAKLAREKPHLDWRYLLAGEGPERARLEALANALGIRKRVHFLGQVSESATLLRGADALVLPSRSEGLPYAVLEAAAAGVSIVATKVGGIPEIVSEAFLAPPGDVDSLARSLASCMETRSASAQDVSPSPSDTTAWSAMVDAVERVYTQDMG